jgi:hypothetical protein
MARCWSPAGCWIAISAYASTRATPRVLVSWLVAPAALHPCISQPAGSVVDELLTGRPEREPGDLVFVADLTGELRAWPNDTWANVGSTGRERPRGGGRLAARRSAGPAAGGPGLERPARIWCTPSSPTGWGASSPARAGVRGSTSTATAGQATSSCSSNHRAGCGGNRTGQQPSGRRPKFPKQQRTADAAAASGRIYRHGRRLLKCPPRPPRTARSAVPRLLRRTQQAPRTRGHLRRTLGRTARQSADATR